MTTLTGWFPWPAVLSGVLKSSVSDRIAQVQVEKVGACDSMVAMEKNPQWRLMADLSHPETRIYSQTAAAHLCITFRASTAPDRASVIILATMIGQLPSITP